MTVPTASGKKFDQSKPPMHLLDPQALEAIADVFGYGQGKYGAWNWKGGISYSRIFSAIMRHLWAFWRGQDLDPETGKPHLAHAGCGIFMLLWHTMERKDLDDRYVPTSDGGCPAEIPHKTFPDVLKIDTPNDDKYNADGVYSLDPKLQEAIAAAVQQAASDAATEQYSFYGGGTISGRSNGK
jgi:hypothetical protein